VIKLLVKSGVIVICAGGGGIPVADSGGALHGVDAVIDKDLSSALLAQKVGAEALLLLTDIPVCLEPLAAGCWARDRPD
jgi:carbamate kinase